MPYLRCHEATYAARPPLRRRAMVADITTLFCRQATFSNYYAPSLLITHRFILAFFYASLDAKPDFFHLSSLIIGARAIAGRPSSPPRMRGHTGLVWLLPATRKYR